MDSESPDITTVSNTLYNRTSWTTQHALSSDHLPIITTINIRHDYRLQQNRRTFTNYKKEDWTQFTEDTESAFAQTTIPTNIHTANRIFTNIILMADKQNIPKGKMHSNCRLLPEDIVCIHTSLLQQTLSPLDLWTDPAGVTALLARWTEKLAGGPQTGTSDSPPPTSKGPGSG